MKRTLTIMLLSLCLPACAGTPQLGAPSAFSRPAKVVAECPSGLVSEQELKLNLARDLALQGKLYAALAQLNALPEKAPAVLRQKGDITRRLGMAEAKDYYLRLRSTCLVGYAEHGLGLIAAAHGDYEEAEQLLRKAATYLPTDYQIRNDLGLVYLYLNRDKDAHFQLMTSLELAQGDSLPAVNLLSLFLLMGDVKQISSLSNQMQFSGDQLADAMSRCSEVDAMRVAALGLKEDPKAEEAGVRLVKTGCQWKIIESIPSLSALVKSPKVKSAER